MKIYISADIEGVTGITSWDEANLAEPTNAEFRERMTAEVTAACDGAFSGGATELWIKDAHWTGRNLFAEELPQEARLVRGWSGHPYGMVQGIDDTFSAALFVGWHSAGATGGNPLAHTLSSSRIHAIRVNGEIVSEFHLYAWACAMEDVPVAFVSGDEELCAAVRLFDPEIETVAVSRGIGASTVSIHPELARDRIQEGVELALSRGVENLEPQLPDSFELEVVHKDAREAYRKSFFPGARLATPTTVAFETDEAFELLRAVQFVL